MTKSEYEKLQDLFSKKITKCEYLGRNKEGAYRDGILACKSILKTVYEQGGSNDD